MTAAALPYDGARKVPGAPNKSAHKRVNPNAHILAQTDPKARALLLHFESARIEIDHAAAMARYEIERIERLLHDIDTVRQLRSIHKAYPSAKNYPSNQVTGTDTSLFQADANNAMT